MTATHGVAAARTPDRPVRGERLLRACEALFMRADAAIPLPDAIHPLKQAGALANLNLFVAIVSGIVLLYWYTPSVEGAWRSVEAMGASPLGAGLLRSLHRYSSDATMLFALLHAGRLFTARRFTGARWLAWVTGIALVGLLWIVGWLGYWLVWDGRARQVALGTARLADALPIFAEPLSRSFLTDQHLSSLFFFVVFFIHMLLPLAMGVALWLHIARVARAKFLTGRALTLGGLAALLIVSLAAPADLAAPARMAAVPGTFALDLWYLAPIALTDRLGAAWLWALTLFGGAGLLAVPWLLGRGRAEVAVVDAGRCQGCTLCYKDCPYNAISMTTRPDGTALAVVDPATCVGCGICAGSCDSAAIGLPWIPVLSERRRLDEALSAAPGAWVAMVCGALGAADALKGWSVVDVPCAGWVQALSVERALRHGASGVLIVGCASCRFREGSTWAGQRMAGDRPPAIRADKVDRSRVRVVAIERHQHAELAREAAGFRAGLPLTRAPRPAFVALLAAAALSLAVLGATRVAYSAPRVEGAQLVVSFKHPGIAGENCHTLSPEELAALPPHMRREKVCSRERASVRLRLEIDGREVLRRAYAPRGLWGDGNSVAIERLTVPAGSHRVAIRLGETTDADEWTFVDTRDVVFGEDEQRVILFDRGSRFGWF